MGSLENLELVSALVLVGVTSGVAVRKGELFAQFYNRAETLPHCVPAPFALKVGAGDSVPWMRRVTYKYIY